MSGRSFVSCPLVSGLPGTRGIGLANRLELIFGSSGCFMVGKACRTVDGHSMPSRGIAKQVAGSQRKTARG
jgi:hypothetical protein